MASFIGLVLHVLIIESVRMLFLWIAHEGTLLMHVRLPPDMPTATASSLGLDYSEIIFTYTGASGPIIGRYLLALPSDSETVITSVCYKLSVRPEDCTAEERM